jgi:Fur family ferric uptake transcriptional regulator
LKNFSKHFKPKVVLLSSRVIIENSHWLILSLSSQYNVITSPLGEGLHKDGKRLTPQRLKVLNLFENIGSGKHLSAEEVHEKLVKTSSKVSLATIYRTLRLLVQMGLLHELELSEGGHRYELLSNETPDHHHLICIRCGRTEEFENDQVLEAGKVAAKVNGFKLIESSLNVRAICPNCI